MALRCMAQFVGGELRYRYTKYCCVLFCKRNWLNYIYAYIFQTMKAHGTSFKTSRKYTRLRVWVDFSGNQISR